jgi:glycosyltransferase involved in cell wall biosynthesis
MPNSIIEAFACGLPVVTTRAGGIPYVVEHERNGLLVDCGDDEGLARAALRLLEDPALAQRVIAEGLRDVEQQYTWASVSDRWAALYRRLVRARDAAPVESMARNAETDAARLLPEASTR